MGKEFDALRARSEKLAERVEKLSGSARDADERLQRIATERDRIERSWEKASEEGERERLRRDLSSLDGEVKELHSSVRRISYEIADVEKEETDVSKGLDDLRKRYADAGVERSKVYLEIFKLVATLSTAIIIGITAITVGLLPDKPQKVALLWISYGLLLSSVAGSIGAILGITLEVTRDLSPEPEPELPVPLWVRIAGGFNFHLSLLGLSVGITLFLIFASYNIR